MPQPVITLHLNIFPGLAQEPSLIDAVVVSNTNPAFPVNTVFDTWCLDPNVDVTTNTNYSAALYSSYELNTLSAGMPTLGVPNGFLSNLDSINWLLGFYTGQAPYSIAEMQAAIWKLMGEPLTPAIITFLTTPANGLGALNLADVDVLYNLALANDGYVPQAGQKIGIVADLFDATGHKQPIIIETVAAKLGDFVWFDTDADGRQDAGEVGINGVTVNLWRDLNGNTTVEANEILATTTTGAGSDDGTTPASETTGYYEFNGLTPGLNYQVQFIGPAGYTLSPRQSDGNPLSGVNSDGLLSNVVVLAPGEFNRTLDAGFYQTAKLGDFVWFDTDADGIQDATEVGINGVTVNLFADLDNDGQVDDFVATTITGAGSDDGTTPASETTGYYEFAGLTPGEQYQVQFIGPAGYTLSPRQSDGNPLSGVNSDGLLSDVVVLANGEFNRTLDAGFYQTAKLGDFVWFDTDADGIQDAGEVGINGVTVNLFADLDNDGQVDDFVATTITGAGSDDGTTPASETTGYYEFAGLTPGEQYQVQFIGPAGYTLSPRQSDGNPLSGVNSDGLLSDVVVLANGEFNRTLDAGFYQTAKLGDFVWFDTDADGIQDAGEVGINGVTVNLFADLDNDGQVDDFVATTITGAGSDDGTTPASETTGYYEFAGLTPGEQYQVQFIGPAGYTLSPRQSDGNPLSGVNSDGLLSDVVVLANGEFNRTLDAGFYQTAKLGDFVWFDTDADGIQDATEVGINGVTVNLFADLDNDGQVDDFVATTITGAGSDDGTTPASETTGYYEFAGLTPGEQYQVQFIGPAGYTLSPRQSDGNPLSAVNSDGLLSDVVVLANGEFNRTLDAGFYQTAKLGDFVWFDTDADGIQDAGEVGINGVTVNLFADLDNDGQVDDFVATTITGAGSDDGTTPASETTGYYEFAGLTPGEQYQVQFIGPAGYTLSPRQSDGNPLSGVNSDGLLSDVVVLANGEFNRTLDAGFYQVPKTPGIDLEKTTNGPTNSNPTAPDFDNEDAANGPGVPILTPGSSVTWTYKVTNTGDTTFQFNDVVVVDDNGTPGNTADDLSSADGEITFIAASDVGADSLLSPGEVWLYQATGIVQNVGAVGSATTFDFSGSSATDGADGNVRTFTAGSISVNASAFSRDKSSGAWSAAFLGAYGGGLGVTDSSEGDGSSNKHTVDNVGRDNYVLFEFNKSVVIDSVFLGYVVSDSDLTVWIGTRTDPFNNHDTMLSDADLTALGFTEVNLTDLTSTRLADLNAGNISGNVMVVSAWTGDDTPDDQFKLEKVKVRESGGIYENKATVTAPGTPGDSDLSHYKNPAPLTPRIDLEKTTNGPSNSNPTAPDYDNEDAAGGAGVPILTPGSSVTWTYKVTNTGDSTFDKSVVAIVDDNGTPGNTADDLSVANGKITFHSVAVGDADNLLEPGEVWLYKATGIVQTVTTISTASTFDFSGSSASDGTNGNIRTFTAGEVSVKASAFSRDDSGAWSTAWLGAYGGGLGVTDSSEGDGSSNKHTVDNVGRDNYVLFEFNKTVVVDSAFLGYIVDDSDMTVWIGTRTDPFNNHVTLSDAVLSGLGFTEINLSDLTSTRLADLNAGNISGNVLVLSAWTGDDTPDDRFKIEKVTVKQSESGVYENKATVTAPGAPSDSDLSHYKNPAPTPASIGDRVWEDKNYNGIQDGGESGISGVTVKLLNSGGTVVATTTTNGSGNYLFNNLTPADYKVQVVAPSGYYVTKKDQGANNATDSDVDGSGITALTTLTSGENDLSWDAGLYLKAKVGDKVWEDKNHNNIQDATEPGIGGITVKLIGAGNDGIIGNGDDSVLATTTTNSSGNYLFSNLNPGSYILQFDKTNVYYNGYNMSNWMWAKKDIGANDAVDSDVAGDAVSKTNVTKTSAFTLVSGQSDLTRDAGITPIVIDLDGNGVQTVSRADSGGTFDLFGNGKAVASGWISGSDGFLAVDLNGNGKIDSIDELFGGTAKGAGFAKLATFDSNGDGVVSNKDLGYAALSVWQDINGNHQTDAGELFGLAAAGVSSLTVASFDLPFMDANGNLHLERSSATMSDGRSVETTDVYFGVDVADAEAAGVALQSLADLMWGSAIESGSVIPTIVEPAQLADSIGSVTLVGQVDEGQQGYALHA